MYEQNAQASELLNDMYMEKQAGIKQTIGRYKDLITGKTLKETEEFVRQFPSLSGDLYREVKKAKAKRKKIIKGLVGTGVIGTGAAGAFALKKHHDKKAFDLLNELYMEKTAIAFSGKRLSDIKDDKDYDNLDMIRDVAGNIALSNGSKIIGGIATELPLKKNTISSAVAPMAVVGRIMGTTGTVAGVAKRGKSYIIGQEKQRQERENNNHDKKAFDLLDEMYMEKQAGVTNTPRLY